MKKIKALAILSVVILLFAGCSNNDDVTLEHDVQIENAVENKENDTQIENVAENDKLLISYDMGNFNLPTIIEREQGIFEKHFKDYDVEYIGLSENGIEEIIQGHVDILNNVDGVEIIKAVDGGADIKIISIHSKSNEKIMATITRSEFAINNSANIYTYSFAFGEVLRYLENNIDDNIILFTEKLEISVDEFNDELANIEFYGDFTLSDMEYFQEIADELYATGDITNEINAFELFYFLQ